MERKFVMIIVSLVILPIIYLLMEKRYEDVIQTRIHTSKKTPKLFKFDPMEIKDCRDIYKGKQTKDLHIPERYKFIRPLLDAEVKRHGGEKTGHVGWKPLQTAFLLDFVNASFIKTVCETGFNAGHSALVWLTGNEKCRVFSFDLGVARYSKPTSNFLQKAFPGRLETTWGDSKITVPEFTKRNLQVKCDLIFVDGGHGYPEVKADLRNLRAHANTDFHVLMVDDYTDVGVYKAWTEELKNSQLAENFNCSTRKGKVWSVAIGKYVNLP